MMKNPNANAEAAALMDGASIELDERRLQVVADQAVGLRWQILLTATIVAAIVWQSVPTAVVLAWFAAVIGSRELRASALAHMASDRQQPIAARLHATVLWNVLIGACNGSAALFMSWLDPSLDAVLTMILVSWGAGAVSTSATIRPAFLAYASLLFVPTALMWALSGTRLGLGIAALVLMFFGVQSRFARRNLETFEESFRIRLENEALATSLEFERAQLAVARDAAVKANQDKSRFLAAASHDLRQPLQAMALNVGALRHLSMSGEARQVSEVVDTSLEQLCSMLDALLDVSKLDAGVVVAQPRRVQLDRLVAAVMGGFGAAAAGRQLQLDWHCPPELAVHSDPDLLRRILANLVDNAIKFTPAGGRVELQVLPHEGDVELTVRDTGPGIAPEHHQLIFEDLVRLGADGPATVSGHGLGLGIVRRMADLMKLPITVESSPGAGATFSLRLPLADTAQVAALVSEPAWSLAGRRVLVLDDDSMVRGAYVNALAAMGCRALAAATLDDALAQLSGASCDAAVVDFRLGGGVEGLEAVERLRGLEPSLPVVMVSADKDDAVVGAARRHALALLRKPVDAPTLGRTISAAIAAR